MLDEQPIVDLKTGEMDRHELLLRIADENGEMLPAGRFIQTAEQYGMVQELDRWVVGQAIELLDRFEAKERQGRNHVALHVNLSGSSITDASVLEYIERSSTPATPSRARSPSRSPRPRRSRNFETAAAFADRLREFGCQVAIDDFGVGFGSFYYLKHLPFDCSRSTASSSATCREATPTSSTSRAIVDIARGLGKRTIAECVEDDDRSSCCATSASTWRRATISASRSRSPNPGTSPFQSA